MNRALAFLFIVFTLTGCLGTDCINEVHQELVSPDGNKKIVIFSRNCGATTGVNTQASVLGKSDKLPDEAGNAFVIDIGAARVSWKKDGGVLVVIESGARVFKKEPSVSGIGIEYHE